jgi:hypothetical protein
MATTHHAAHALESLLPKVCIVYHAGSVAAVAKRVAGILQRCRTHDRSELIAAGCHQVLPPPGDIEGAVPVADTGVPIPLKASRRNVEYRFGYTRTDTAATRLTRQLG